MRLVTAHTAKAISHEDKAMTLITYGSSVSAGNAKTRRHERRRKLAMERDTIGNIIDTIFGCVAPDDSQEEIRKHAGRVDRATSLEFPRDYHEECDVVSKPNRIFYSKPRTEMGITCAGRQKVKGKSIPAYYD